MIDMVFFTWLQNLSILDLLVILLFPAIFDYSRMIGKIIYLELNKTKDNINSYYKVHDPKVSILIPAHNEELSIEHSINAALSTTYPNKQIIVIDDDSTDDTYSIAKKFTSQGLKLLHLNKGGSKADALNFGFLYCTGDIVITIDADTVIGKHSIEPIVRKFDDKEVMAVSGNVRIKSGDNGIINTLTHLQKYEYQNIFEVSRRCLSMLNILLLVSGAFAAFRREAINWEGRFSNDTLCEDLDKTLQVQKMGAKIAFANNAYAYTFCPNKIRDFARQRNRWSYGQVQNIIKHKSIFSGSIYKKKLRLAFYDMVMMDVILNFTCIISIGILCILNAIPIITNFDFTLLEEILSKMTLLLLLYLVYEGIVFSYLRSQKLVSLKSIYLIPVMVFLYRPMLRIITIKAQLNALLGRKSSW